MKVDEKQQKMITRLFKEWTSWCPEHVGNNFIAAILIGISMIFWIMPYQIWEWEDYEVWGIIYMGELIGISFYAQKFIYYKEGTKMKKLYEVFRNLPVSYTQLHIFRIRKIMKLCLWLTGSTVICQIVFAAVFLHTFSMGNICYPFLGHFIIPLLSISGTEFYEEMRCGNYS